MNNHIFFKALSDETRLKILKILLKEKKETCTCILTDAIKKDQSVIYRHLLMLSDVGIIETRKQDKCLMCKIKDSKRIKKILEA
ncbi:metalloregulator ArsR/SmtB family transcription factor [Candidatus Woesearchaeota archaeon]|nr:metalloregulator ArsR/SmtB family transcription factor [Candidatus Woesearchaeota archaeon]